MVGIPATLHITLVWIPALLTAVLSFTEWDNLLPISEVSPVGFRNYWQIFTIFDNRLFPAMFNNLMLIAWSAPVLGDRDLLRLPVAARRCARRGRRRARRTGCRGR